MLQRSITVRALLMCVITLVLVPGLSKGAAAQSLATTTAEEQAETKAFSLKLFGGGGLLTDLASTKDASSIRGQLGLQVMFPNRVSIAAAFNATQQLGDTLQSARTTEFGANIVNPDLGPYSVAVDAKWLALADIFGPYTYVRFTRSTWVLADSDSAETLGKPSYGALPYAAGLGAVLSWANPPAVNDVRLEAAFGLAIRGVGGDITQDAKAGEPIADGESRLMSFIGSESSIYAAPELSFGFNFNALRASASLMYFPSDGVDGLSDFRMVVGVGGAGDVVKVVN